MSMCTAGTTAANEIISNQSICSPIVYYRNTAGLCLAAAVMPSNIVWTQTTHITDGQHDMKACRTACEQVSMSLLTRSLIL